MPKIKQRDPMLLAEAERQAFEDGFGRSHKGNLWRKWEGVTLTIFLRRDEYFGFCIADGEETRFSRERYDFEEDALAALAEQMGV